MTKIGIVSDIHTELWDESEFDRIGKLIQDTLKDADLVLMPGDIGAAWQAVNACHRLFPDKPVCFVPGNHEFWHLPGTPEQKIQQMEARAKVLTNVNVLNRSVYYHDNLRIIGTTLWTDFNLFGTQPISMLDAEAFMKDADYRWGMNSRIVLDWHRQDKEWMLNEIEKPFDGTTIALMHHAPVSFAVKDRYKTHPGTPCFASALENEFIDRNVDLVVFGHTHQCLDQTIENTRFFSDQVGYRGVDINQSYFTETGSFGTIIVL